MPPPSPRSPASPFPDPASLTTCLICSVEYPEDQINTLEAHEHVQAVEKDQEVRTQ